MQIRQTTMFIRIFKISWILLFFLFCSCTSTSVIGTYKSSQPNFVVQQFEKRIQKKGRTLGTVLRLNKDSTYNYETCANYGIGNWSIINDSLILFPDSLSWKSDSLNEKRPIQIDEKRFSYYIQGTTLISLFSKKENNGNTLDIYDVVEKVEVGED